MKNLYGFEYGIEKVTTTYGNGQQDCKFAVTITGPDIAYRKGCRKRKIEGFNTFHEAERCYNDIVGRMITKQTVERIL